jgi:hypothetical protein
LNPDVDFFVREAVRLARSMPYPQMLSFLQGMTLSVDFEAFPEVRQILFNLRECDRQLELIATGQMRFELETSASTSGRRSARKQKRSRS